MNRTPRLTLAIALSLLAGAALAHPAATQTQTGSLIPVPLQTVEVRTPTMAYIRHLSIHPLVQPLANGTCAITGASYSDIASIADGPMPHVAIALIGPGGQRIRTRTGYNGIYRAVVPSGTWREWPRFHALPFGVHWTRPVVHCVPLPQTTAARARRADLATARIPAFIDRTPMESGDMQVMYPPQIIKRG